MRKFFAIIGTSLILSVVSGCTFLDDVGAYANENPVAVQIVTRQAVFRYIDAGTTEARRDARAAAVLEVVKRADSFLEGNPTTTVDGLLSLVESSIDWGALDRADRALVQDIMTLVSVSLTARQREGLLDEDTVIGLRAILRTSLEAAQLL